MESRFIKEAIKEKKQTLLLMQNPLFKCTKNVTYHLPLHEKRGHANFKTKRNFNYNRKKNTLATNQWYYAGHYEELTSLRRSKQLLKQVLLRLGKAVYIKSTERPTSQESSFWEREREIGQSESTRLLHS